MSDSQTPPHAASITLQNQHHFGVILSSVTGVLLFAIGFLMVNVLFSQLGNYQKLIDAILAKGTTSDVGIALAFARAYDLAVIKTSAMFLAFMLILLGGLYTFRVGESLYRLAAEGAAIKGSLETASPGLVMMTLGIVIFSVTIMKEHSVSIQGLQLNPTTATDKSVEKANVVAVNTVSAMPNANLSSVRIDQIRAINSVIVVLDKKRAELRDGDAVAWDGARGRLDGLRKEMILQQHPSLVGKWADWTARLANDQNFTQTLSMRDKTEFESAQKLLQENLFPK